MPDEHAHAGGLRTIPPIQHTAERAASTCRRVLRYAPDSVRRRNPHAATITAAEAPNGTDSINAISTVGIEISASTTTTDVDRSTVLRDTMAATNARPNMPDTATVSNAIARFVRDPAISQLSTSAPTPSVPNGCAADGRGPCVESVGLQQRMRRPYERNQRNQHPQAEHGQRIFAAGFAPYRAHNHTSSGHHSTSCKSVEAFFSLGSSA